MLSNSFKSAFKSKIRMYHKGLGYNLWFITVYDIETEGEKISIQVKDRDYSQALTAAVIAVAKEVAE